MQEPSKQDEEFLAAYDASEFPKPSVAVDVAVVTVSEGALHVLLVQRQAPPFQDHWALPGGFVGLDESLDAAAQRVLQSKAGLSGIYLEQLYSFGAIERDPRTRVISVGYFSLVPSAALLQGLAQGPASEPTHIARLEVPWPGEKPLAPNEAPQAQIEDQPVDLAFDHAAQLALLVQRLRGKLDYGSLAFALLPERFTLRQLQDVHEAILGRALNKDSFRRRQLASKLVHPTGERESDVLHRPAELYRFANPLPDSEAMPKE